MPLSSQDVPPPTSLSLLSRPLSSFPSRRSGCPSFGCPSSDFTIISPAYPSSPDHTPGAPSAHPSQMFPWLNHRPLLRLRALPWPGTMLPMDISSLMDIRLARLQRGRWRPVPGRRSPHSSNHKRRHHPAHGHS
ncbi:hypothetical protein L202_02557, partial [Cryptococcus amylolentus CBS 6039]